MALNKGRKFVQTLGKRARLVAPNKLKQAFVKQPQRAAAPGNNVDTLDASERQPVRDPDDKFTTQAVGQAKPADAAKPAVEVKRTDALPRRKSLFRRLFTTKTFALTLGTTVACVAIAGLVSACLPTPLGPVALVILGIMVFSGISAGIYLSHKWEKEGLEEGHARKGAEQKNNTPNAAEEAAKQQQAEAEKKSKQPDALDKPTLEIKQAPRATVGIEANGPDQSQIAAQGTDRNEKERQKQAGTRPKGNGAT